MSVINDIGKKIFVIITKISPMTSCKLLYFIRVKKWPNLKKPKTLNEKTTWLKMNVYNKNKLVSKCSDKYLVRQYLEEKKCSGILNELYGVYENFSDIDFDKLPNKFVIKCTHGCAYNIICRDKTNFDINEAEAKVSKWMNEKYGLATTELHYLNIVPRIIVEKYISDEKGDFPMDYKFYCFNGKVKYILVCSERSLNKKHSYKHNYYDVNWNSLYYDKKKYTNYDKINKPKKLDMMIKTAELLSDGFPFVRVDLYNDNGKIIFGELTFTPTCCCSSYYNSSSDKMLGTLLDINNLI